MAHKYTAAGTQTTTAATMKTLLTIIATAATRIGLYDVIVGTDGTPADNALRFAVTRWTTSAGTTTATPPVPQKLDDGDVAAITSCGFNHTIEPTYAATTDLADIPLNQRATFRWIAGPDGEIRNPATATTGLGIRVLSAAYTGSTRCTAMWYE